VARKAQSLALPVAVMKVRPANDGEKMTTHKTVSRLNTAALWIRLALVIVFAGWLLFVVSRPRVTLPVEGSPEVTFARDMMAHHAQAVEMAVILRERSQEPTLRTFLLDIILTQQAQMGQMYGWLAVWNVPQSGLEPPMQGMGETMGMATRDDINALETLNLNEAEVKFLQLMIRHHQGGVMMAQSLLKQSQRSEVTTLANAIVQGQTSEIDSMIGLLHERGGEVLEPLPPMKH
jgi:uncharacterized protein (DUF305 family)